MVLVNYNNPDWDLIYLWAEFEIFWDSRGDVLISLRISDSNSAAGLWSFSWSGCAVVHWPLKDVLRPEPLLLISAQSGRNYQA